MAAAFGGRILLSYFARRCARGAQRLFFCGKLVCGFLREACAQDSAGGARVAFFRAAYGAGRFARIVFAFYAQTRRNFLGGLASLRRRRFFCLALPIARLSAWRVCAMRLAERKDLRADFFFARFFCALRLGRNESWRNFNLMACGCARRFSSPPFGCNLHGARGRFWNNFADFFAGFFSRPYCILRYFALTVQ